MCRRLFSSMCGTRGRLLAFAGFGLLVCLTTVSATNAVDKTQSEPATKAKGKVDFKTDVAPILQKNCVDCHGLIMHLAGLRLDQRRFAIDEGAARGLIEPGKSNESLVIQRLVDKDLGLIMPPSFPFFPGEKPGLAEKDIATLKKWIDEGADWPVGIELAAESKLAADDPRANALFAAIRAGDHKMLSGLLDDKSLVKKLDKHGSTPLMHAALYSDVDMMRLFIDRGADVNHANEDGVTALFWGAGDIEKVRLLLTKGANVDVRTELGRTPLLVASTYSGNVEVVQLLLKNGAKPTDIDNFGETPLTSAAKRGDAQIIEALVEAGADVHAGGRPPLAWAAEEGNAETVACLLKYGAGKNKNHLNQALFSAAVRGPVAAVRFLLEYGGDPSAHAGFAGYTPLMGAAYSELESAETVKLLLGKGADVKVKGANGETALSLAKKRGRTEVVELLQKAGATVVAVSAAAVAGAAEKEQLQAAAEKSVALLQKTGPEFFRKSGCVSCHHQTVTALAVGEARKHGFTVDEKMAREQLQVTALIVKSYRTRQLQRADHPANSAPSTGYLLLGMAAEQYPPDEITDANIIEMAGRQTPEGSWTAFGHRPPLEYSRIGATALAIRAMQLYGPPGLKAQFDRRIARARDWLVAAEPASNAEHAFRLLGLSWTGADKKLIAGEVEVLRKEQREDGGWSQLPELESDAYATGVTMYALRNGSGLDPADTAFQKGVAYLLKTQCDDGSWFVKTRAFPFQPYFESGFPYGPDQWISATATGFAAVALMYAAP